MKSGNTGHIDDGVKSIVDRNKIIFEKYTKEQLFTLLKERCSVTLRPKVISDELIDKIASITEQ